MTEKRKEALKIFKRRYGHYCLGVFILLCIIILFNIDTSNHKSDTLMAFNEDDRKTNYNDMYDFDSMDLSFEITLAAFDGESFIYSIYFDHNVTAEDTTEIDRRINAECTKYPEDVYTGYISKAEVYKSNAAMLMLDLGEADNEDMITGIVQSLNGMEGVEKVIINEDL